MLFGWLFVAMGVQVAAANTNACWHSLLQTKAERPADKVAAHEVDAHEVATASAPGQPRAQAAEGTHQSTADEEVSKVYQTFVGQPMEEVYQTFVGQPIEKVLSAMQKTGIPIRVPQQHSQPQAQVTTAQWLLNCLLGWATWVAMAFVVVSCCYIRNYVPNGPVEDGFKDMSSGRFSCFSDCHVCCCAVLFPGIRWADTMAQAKLLTFWPAFFAFSGMAMLNVVFSGGIFFCGLFTIGLCVYFRQELRKKLKLSPVWQAGVVLEDFCFVCWCSCCAIAQEAMVVRQAIQKNTEGFEHPEPQVMDS